MGGEAFGAEQRVGKLLALSRLETEEVVSKMAPCPVRCGLPAWHDPQSSFREAHKAAGQPHSRLKAVMLLLGVLEK